jgi:hypothetical protein
VSLLAFQTKRSVQLWNYFTKAADMNWAHILRNILVFLLTLLFLFISFGAFVRLGQEETAQFVTVGDSNWDFPILVFWTPISTSAIAANNETVTQVLEDIKQGKYSPIMEAKAQESIGESPG